MNQGMKSLLRIPPELIFISFSEDLLIDMQMQRGWSFEKGASFPLQGHRRCQPFHQLPRGRGLETELKGAGSFFLVLC